MGLQFENLVLNNLVTVCEAIGIAPSSVVRWGPYFQRATKRRPGCQVDLMIQSRYRILYLCEVKFSTDKIGVRAGHEMEAKLAKIAFPKGWLCRDNYLCRLTTTIFAGWR
ncbi:MAG: hypothetical protein AB7F31_04430 [Parachlamydiales bacterium]